MDKDRALADLVFDKGVVLHGPCLERLKELPDNSVESVVTDPPYGLSALSPAQLSKVVARWAAGELDAMPTGKGFMGKSWDAFVPPPAVWVECLRVLKPGGHIAAFAGTRTVHLMALSLQMAGAEIRDTLWWSYATGFPKGHNVSKAIDKQRHGRHDIHRVTAWVAQARDAAGLTNRDIDATFGFNGMAGHWTSQNANSLVPTSDQVPRLLDVLGVALDAVPDEVRRLLVDCNSRTGQPGPAWAQRKVVGSATCPQVPFRPSLGEAVGAVELDITAPATDAAKQWDGWSTALKPSVEPIVLARKPMTGTVAQSVLAHGTGALNIDASRVGMSEEDREAARVPSHQLKSGIVDAGRGGHVRNGGRWPANSLWSHAPGCRQADAEPVWACEAGCPLAELDQQSGTGGASRFFPQVNWASVDAALEEAAPFRYQAKPGKKERNAGLEHIEGPANVHPTVKPVALMRWLITLVTPPGGVVVDPFLGSGTTAVAAVLNGNKFIGCELTDEYLPIIAGRIGWAIAQAAAAEAEAVDDSQPTLFA